MHTSLHLVVVHALISPGLASSQLLFHLPSPCFLSTLPTRLHPRPFGPCCFSTLPTRLHPRPFGPCFFSTLPTRLHPRPFGPCDLPAPGLPAPPPGARWARLSAFCARAILACRISLRALSRARHALSSPSTHPRCRSSSSIAVRDPSESPRRSASAYVTNAVSTASTASVIDCRSLRLLLVLVLVVVSGAPGTVALALVVVSFRRGTCVGPGSGSRGPDVVVVLFPSRISRIACEPLDPNRRHSTQMLASLRHSWAILSSWVGTTKDGSDVRRWG